LNNLRTVRASEFGFSALERRDEYASNPLIQNIFENFSISFPSDFSKTNMSRWVKKMNFLTFRSLSEPPTKGLKNYARPEFVALVAQELSGYY